MARIDLSDGDKLRFEHVASVATRWGGCGCLTVAFFVAAMVPIFWIAGHGTTFRCDRGTATCTFDTRGPPKTFPVAALKGVKAFRYHYGNRTTSGDRRAVELTVEGQDALQICDAPDEPAVVAAHKKIVKDIDAFLRDPKAPPVVEASCEVERFNTQDKFIYTFSGVLLLVLAVVVAAVPRRVEVTFDSKTRKMQYLVRRLALPRGVREVPFDEIREVELVSGRTGRLRALSLVMKNGERWALASAAVGTPVDVELDLCKVEIESFLRVD